MTARYHQPASARHIQTADLFIEEESNFQYQHAVPLTAPAPQAARQGPQPQVHHHHHYERPLSLLPKHEVTPFTGSGEPSLDCFREDFYGYLEASNIDADAHSLERPSAVDQGHSEGRGIIISGTPPRQRRRDLSLALRPLRVPSPSGGSCLRFLPTSSTTQRIGHRVLAPFSGLLRIPNPQGSWGLKGRLHLLFTGNMFEPTQYFERFKATDEERLRLCSPSSLPEIKR